MATWPCISGGILKSGEFSLLDSIQILLEEMIIAKCKDYSREMVVRQFSYANIYLHNEYNQ
jgi:hypothetical protein